MDNAVKESKWFKRTAFYLHYHIYEFKKKPIFWGTCVMTVANWNDQNKNCFSQLILSWNQTIIVCFLYVYKRVYLRILKLHWNNLCVNVVHSINYFSFFKTVLIVENNYISYCLDYMYYITLHLLLIVFAVDYVFQIHRMCVDFENLIFL